MRQFKTLREYENLHIVLWILKDTSWCQGWRWLGMIMIVPTLFVAIDITRRTRHRRAEFHHNLAVCAWICANAIWMTGEFFFNDTLRLYSALFFAAGALALASYYLPLFMNKYREA